MAIEVVVPRQGWSMEEGTFVEWLKQNGDRVEEGDMLYVLETDKASAEIESFDKGFLHLPPDAPQAGEQVAVGQRIAFLIEEGEPVSDLTGSSPETAETDQADPVIDPIRPKPTGASVGMNQPAMAQKDMGPTISPRAARRAAQLGIDWTRLQGSGRTGRIRETDVLRAAEEMPTTTSTTPATIEEVPERIPEEIPLSGIRRTIADRMKTSLQSTAQLTLHRSFDASSLLSFHRSWKKRREEGDTQITVNDMILFVTSRILTRHGAVNAHFLGDRIIQYPQVHLGMATDTPRGLMVPVLRNADRKSLIEIAGETKKLSDDARSERIKPDHMRGGTFTVSTLGSLGVETFTPVLNPPEVAILGVGGIFVNPRRTDVGVEHSDGMRLSLTIDHQAVDGAPAARFLADLALALENFELSVATQN